MNTKISLEACRVNAGMNQSEWGKKLGVARTTVFNWEQGYSEPTASQLRTISELSTIPIEFIFVPKKSKNVG
jgi:DNA-binding XRE family transcriptional regulator